MDKTEAERLFEEADRLYREERYEQALDLIEKLNETFPDKHRLLYPQARCLAHLGRNDEATEICDHLLGDLHYDRAVELREQLDNFEVNRRFDSKFDSKFSDPHFGRSTPSGDISPIDSSDVGDGDSESFADLESIEMGRGGRRTKPVLFLIVIGLVGAAVAGYIPWWVAAIPIVAYFVLKFSIRVIVYRLFTVPFKMKGKALAGARVEVHVVQPCSAPSDEEPDEDERSKKGLAWFEVVATITPQERSEGFTNWEPGELTLLPSTKSLRKLDDLDQSYSICAVEIFDNNKFVEDEGHKIHGAYRIKFRVALPAAAGPFNLVYYLEMLEGDTVSV